MEYRVDDKHVHEDETVKSSGDLILDGEAYLRVKRKQLEVIRRELGLVKLSWSGWQKVTADDDQGIDDDYFERVSPTYRSVSDVEKAFLWHAENFRRQYRAAYPCRKSLLLTCSNECSVQKFVSTAIRRAVLPYAELSTWQGCANFVSDFFTYEPLAEPLLLPEHLYSPTYLQHIQRANCFELATFLACLLLGLGYNAYVVSGYASREQSLCDLTKKPCPYLKPPEEVEIIEKEETISKYRPKSPLNFESQFLLAIEKKRLEQQTREKEEYEEARRQMIIEAERPAPDHLFGQRIHAWIVMLPGGKVPSESQVNEPLFIEPTTGNSYASNSFESANIYLGIESLWNDQNYWVNMQDCTESCTKLNWDLSDLKCWEHLLAGEPRGMRDLDNADDYDEDEHAREAKIRENFHMVMPVSYIDVIELPYEAYERRYPGGQKMRHYKKTKVQLHAPYARSDGLVESVITYDDYEYKMPLFIYEKYENRCDCLERSEKDLNEEIVTDFYAIGRPDACHVHRYSMHGRNSVDDERTLEFHSKKRHDELICIKMQHAYASLDYENREDGLYNRFVEYAITNDDNTQDDAHYRSINKIIDSFHPKNVVGNCMNVAVREYDFVDSEIRFTYHYGGEEYTQTIKRFFKPARADRSNKNPTMPEVLENYQPDPMKPADDVDKLTDELDVHLRDEDTSITEARHAETVVYTFLKLRLDERLKSAMHISRFDPIRNEENRQRVLLEEERRIEQSKKDIEQDIAYLSPFIAQLGNIKYLTKTQALQVKTNCLDSFKKSSVSKANRILREFEKFNAELENMQSIMMDSEHAKKELKEELSKKIKEVEAILRCLDLWLNRHRDLVTTRYGKLVKVLQEEKQLAILHDE